ncbi:uncharacterized protein LOC128225148 [Mya arenaria]|uniref:uncharacterized protein LOC128225148 n=1 Tax=Mya arenaria TaxID=6604 RepID=UPI0022E7D351|nr:uncharacterized protein LOC128225148 [Mya arenaria]XP_052791151.1 uncharacterized protein LOC128225148 [Mya arenaria]XP_052791152.1 uncharacterized protein LOC128225148 [Mya arenaria]XP_052791153.1 uncharacterized protein LOC128225148 [Mya arenaria]
MVFREDTTLEVKSMVKRLETTNTPRGNSVIEGDVARSMTSSVEEHTTKPKLQANTRHARSCLGSNLFHSVFKGRIKKVKFLIENGVNVNNRNDYGYSVLLAALHIDNPEKRSKMFRYLLNNEADPFAKDPRYKRSALAWSAILGRNEQTNVLLDNYMGELNLHEKDRDGMTPLHLATISGHTDVVTSLVREMTKFGTSVDVPDNMGLTPYLHAKRLGYGLIADILKEEGGASAGQGDMYTFKRADEWREIGIKERNEEVKQRRNTLYEHAAMAGSARMLMEFEGPGYEIITIPSPKPRRRCRVSRTNSISDTEGDDTSAPKSVRIRSPISQISLPAGNNLRAYHHENKHALFDAHDSSSMTPSRQLDTMSLIQMREPRKGIAPRPFRSSELDTAKAKEYKHIVGDITTMMDFLTMHHSKSFRPSVPPLKLPEREASNSLKKGSTLAIIFGKGGKKSRKSPTSNGDKKRDKNGSGRSKRQQKVK